MSTTIDEKYGQIVVAVEGEGDLMSLAQRLNELEPPTSARAREFTLAMVQALVTYASIHGVITAKDYIETVAKEVEEFPNMSSQGMGTVRAAFTAQQTMRRRAQTHENLIAADEARQLAQAQFDAHRIQSPTRPQQEKVGQVMLLLRTNGLERHADAIEDQMLSVDFEPTFLTYRSILDRFIPILHGRGVNVPRLNAEGTAEVGGNTQVSTELKTIDDTPDLVAPSEHTSDVVVDEEIVEESTTKDPFG